MPERSNSVDDSRPHNNTSDITVIPIDPCSEAATKFLNYLRKGVDDLEKLTDPDYAEARAKSNPAHATNILDILENQNRLLKFRNDLAELEQARLEAGCGDDNQILLKNDVST